MCRQLYTGANDPLCLPRVSLSFWHKGNEETIEQASSYLDRFVGCFG